MDAPFKNVHKRFFLLQENRSHIFLPEKSGALTENDVLMVPNLALISGIPNVKALGFIAEIGFKTILATTKPKEFHNLTAGQYTSGYNDKFMSLIEKIKWDFDSREVGILAPRHGIDKKSVTVFSGTKDLQNIGKLYAINNKTKINIWKSDECNKIAGSDGIINGPSQVQNKKDISVYLTNICRTLPLVFDREMKITNGMRSYRYEAPYGAFSSPESYPENKHYCELKSVNRKHIDGILEISDCIDGTPPIIISHPHFMEGDEKLFEHFEGLKPNKNLHNSYVYLHPRLSVPLLGVSRMQLNLRVNQFSNYYKNLPDGLILPLAWIETTTEDFPDKISLRLFLSTVVVDYAEILLKYGSLISLLMSLIFVTVNQTCGVLGIIKFCRKLLHSSLI